MVMTYLYAEPNLAETWVDFLNRIAASGWTYVEAAPNRVGAYFSKSVL